MRQGRDYKAGDVAVVLCRHPKVLLLEIRVLIGLCRHPQMLVLGIQVLLWFLRICLTARANIWIPA